MVLSKIVCKFQRTIHSSTLYIPSGRCPVYQLAPNTYAVHRSRNCLQYGDYMYTIEKKRCQRTYYHCAEARQLGCRSRLVVLTASDGTKEHTQFKEHTHAAKRRARPTDAPKPGVTHDSHFGVVVSFSSPKNAAATTGSTQLIHNGILFYRHYQRGDTVYWRCSRSNADVRCRARLTSRAQLGTITEINRHNHDTGTGTSSTNVME